ncbi:protein RDM1-like [Pyrus ussuriensis x Pyrus communis]|uniref:Protein RDM1-like n=1 Tax=Pyrus ussuriensis x Pyrus communis TaxID=2448454 RepID=A0A5N5FER3_9ROSA|nr:protein RDM1-like [Pyrus ussuriensis x Pyrus communis]
MQVYSPDTMKRAMESVNERDRKQSDGNITFDQPVREITPEGMCSQAIGALFC